MKGFFKRVLWFHEIFRKKKRKKEKNLSNHSTSCSKTHCNASLLFLADVSRVSLKITSESKKNETNPSSVSLLGFVSVFLTQTLVQILVHSYFELVSSLLAVDESVISTVNSNGSWNDKNSSQFSTAKEISAKAEFFFM